MSYQATAYEVMIASPGDVLQEREVIRTVIADWNAVHSRDRQIVLMPVGWETHAAPAMGDRPQGIINKQILDKADLLIAVFWTRLGSPTGEADSGTVEEIERHIATGKPAMIYFSLVPVRLDRVSNEQYDALMDFKESLRRRGLYEEYEDIHDFRTKLTRQLAKTVIDTFRHEGAAVDGNTAVPQNASSDPIDTTVDELTWEAKDLLLAAAGGDGTIMRYRLNIGLVIQAGHKDLVETGNPRSEAEWESGLDQLFDLGLIKDMGYKRELFSVTGDGYKVADRLAPLAEDAIG